MPRLIQVIESTRCAGSGIDDDPVRIVTQYFSPEGEYLAEHDSWILSERESVDEQREHLDEVAKFWATVKNYLGRYGYAPDSPTEAWPMVRDLMVVGIKATSPVAERPHED